MTSATIEISSDADIKDILCALAMTLGVSHGIRSHYDFVANGFARILRLLS